MDHLKRLKETLTPKVIAEGVCGIVIDAWEAGPERNNELFAPGRTLADFKKLDGFWASRQILREITAGFIGRACRFYVLRFPDSAEVIPEFFLEADDEPEATAIKMEIEMLTKKYGPVSEERIKELDAIGIQIMKENQAMVESMLNLKKAS